MSVGLGTKGATAHVITALTHQCPLELQQYTGKILSALFTGLSDRNPAVRKTYASAIGQVIKVYQYLPNRIMGIIQTLNYYQLVSIINHLINNIQYIFLLCRLQKIGRSKDCLQN